MANVQGRDETNVEIKNAYNVGYVNIVDEPVIAG